MLCILIHRRRLSFADTFGALRHEEDFDGREHDPDVLKDAGVGDVHQVHDQFMDARIDICFLRFDKSSVPMVNSLKHSL